MPPSLVMPAAGGVAIHLAAALAAGTVQMARWVRARREQPASSIGMAATGSPIQPQLREQIRIKQAMPVLPALALNDVDAHAIRGRVDVAAPQSAAGPSGPRRSAESPGCAQQSRATPSHRSCVGAAVQSSSSRSGDWPPGSRHDSRPRHTSLVARCHRVSGSVQLHLPCRSARHSVPGF